jgi:hypothetical protein
VGFQLGNKQQPRFVVIAFQKADGGAGDEVGTKLISADHQQVRAA